MNRILLPFSLTAIIGAMLLAFATSGNRMEGQAGPQSATIAVEHAGPMRLSLTVGEGTVPAMMDVSHDGAETAGLSVPSSWTLREVRGAALTDVPADTPSLGFTRRALPGGATLSFTLPSAPDGLILYNPSEALLEVRLKRIRLDTPSVQTEVFLFQETQKRLY